MDLNLLSLNCQKAYNRAVKEFLIKKLQSKKYDFLLLQEADEQIMSIIEGEGGSYKILKTINPDIQKQSQLCILYKREFVLKSTDFVSFSKLNRRFALRPELGFLLGTFDYNGNEMVIASLHLHPGFPFYLRVKGIQMVKNKLDFYNDEALPVIFGGDFNLAYPWEAGYTRRFFAPGFIDSTISIGPTLNSRYTEKGNHLASRINDFLRFIGVSIRFKTDRVFMDRYTANKHSVTSMILPNRVSDHSPVELVIKADTNSKIRSYLDM